MAALILELFSKALIASSLYFPSKLGSTVPIFQKFCIRLVVGTARISTLEKENVDCMTEKLNILKRSRVAVMLLLLQTTSRQLVTTSNGTTLIY